MRRNAGGKQRKYQLSVANALWADRATPFQQGFLDTAKQYYGGSVYGMDFRGAYNVARKQINAWVLEKTNGKIKDILQPNDITNMTRFVLVNTIYFKGKWANPFDWIRKPVLTFVSVLPTTCTA